MSTLTLSEKLAAFISPFGVPSNDFQKIAYNNLVELDFPTTKNEYWKYTRVGKIQNSQLKIEVSQRVKQEQLSTVIFSQNYLVIENGFVRADLSHNENSDFEISVFENDSIDALEKLNTSVDQKHIFTALNTAYFGEVISIKIAENKTIEEPLQLIFVTSGKNIISNPRLLIQADKLSNAKIVTSFLSIESESNFTNVVAEFFVGENAHLVYDKIQSENESNFHISTEEITQEKNSNFKINTIILDGLLVRNNINISVAGENCESHMNGVIIAKGNQHVDNHTFVNHKVANCFSNENYKYILEDKSTGVFNGRVIVQKDAQKINAYQKNANILLSDFAQINSKPELEIYADDVKCSHGSTTGQLDDDAVFYLQARGISKDKAKKLLVAAFITEVIDQFSTENQKEQIASILREKHGWGK